MGKQERRTNRNHANCLSCFGILIVFVNQVAFMILNCIYKTVIFPTKKNITSS